MTKARYFGGLRNTRVAADKTQCEELLPSIDKTLFTTTHEPTDNINEPDLICAHCGSERLRGGTRKLATNPTESFGTGQWVRIRKGTRAKRKPTEAANVAEFRIAWRRQQQSVKLILS